MRQIKPTQMALRRAGNVYQLTCLFRRDFCRVRKRDVNQTITRYCTATFNGLNAESVPSWLTKS